MTHGEKEMTEHDYGFEKFIDLCRKKDYGNPIVGDWLVESSRRFVSSMGLQKDSDYEDFVQAGILRMFRELPRLDYSRQPPQLFNYLRRSCEWGVKDELKRRQRFLRKKNLYTYTLQK